MSFSFFKGKRHVWTRSVQSHSCRGACRGCFFFFSWPHEHPTRLSVLALVTEPHRQDEVQEVFYRHASGCWHCAAQQTRIPSSPSKTLEISRVSVCVCVSLFVCLVGRWAQRKIKDWLMPRVTLHSNADAFFFLLSIYSIDHGVFFMIMNSN